MKKEIKVGSKVKYKGKETVVVLESNSPNSWIIEYPFGWYGKDRSFVELNSDTRYWSVSGSDLTLIEETIMKNLLETEFVIENCTLSQRLAIKAYCDEKKIPHTSCLESLEYKSICFGTTRKFTGDNRDSYADSKFNVITFSELIQFLDKYQPAPEFKVGDHIKFLKVVDGRSVGDIVCITSIQADDSYNNMEDVSVKAKGWINYNANNLDKGGFKWGGNGYYPGEHFRHATPEEIKKWKEENEIKLPRINQYDGKVSGDSIVYGNNCAKLKISWFKNIGDVSSFLNIGENRTIRSIKLNSDVEITIAHIEQIKKFIEHNKL